MAMKGRRTITRKADEPTLISFAPSQLLEHVEDVIRQHEVNDWQASNGTLDWSGGLTMRETQAILRDGWKDAPAIPEIEMGDVRREADDLDYNWDVSGEILDVGAFVSGLPEHWLTQVPCFSPMSRTVKVSIEIGSAGIASASTLRIRGLAIIAMINALELAGYSTEINLLCTGSHKSTGHNLTMQFPVKQSGEALDTNRIQFMVGSVSFYRQIVFAMWNSYYSTENMAGNTYCAEYIPKDSDIHLRTAVAETYDLQKALAEVKTYIDTVIAKG